jgi:hypothetical protein
MHHPQTIYSPQGTPDVITDPLTFCMISTLRFAGQLAVISKDRFSFPPALCFSVFMPFSYQNVKPGGSE